MKKLTVLLFCSSIAFAFSGIPPLIDISEKGKACCPLEWKTIRLGTEEEKSLVTVDTTQGAVYLTRSLLGAFGFTTPRSSNGSQVTLLTNPHNCSVVWINKDSKSSATVAEKADLYIPLIDGMSVSLSEQKKYNRYHGGKRCFDCDDETTDYYHYSTTEYYGRSSTSRPSRTKSTLIAEYLSIFKPDSIKSYDSCGDTTNNHYCEIIKRSILHIDCMSSIRNILHPQLESIDYDESLIRQKSVHLRYSYQEMTNTGNLTINETYYSEIKLPVQLQMSLDEESYSFLDYLENKTHVDHFLNSLRESRLANILRLPAFTSQLENIHRLSWPRRDFDTNTISVLRVSEEILIPPQSKCKISTTVTKYRVMQPVVVKLAVAPRKGSEEYWTREKIVESFRASGIHTNRLMEGDKRVTFQYKGFMTVRGYFGEKVESQCERLLDPVNELTTEAVTEAVTEAIRLTSIPMCRSLDQGLYSVPC